MVQQIIFQKAEVPPRQRLSMKNLLVNREAFSKMKQCTFLTNIQMNYRS